MADEYMDVVYKLWESSWHDDAVKRDKKTGIFTDPSLVRPIDHKGTYFKDIPGPVSYPRVSFSFGVHDLTRFDCLAVYLAPFSSADPSALPGRLLGRGYDLWRKGELPKCLPELGLPVLT